MKLERLVETYKSLSQIPSLEGARIQSENVINTTWSQRNIETGKNIKFNRTILLNNFKNSEDTFPVDISTVLISCISKSQKFKAVLRENDTKQFLEIWQISNLIRTVDLAALDVHGNVYTDVEFSSFEFSPDETKLLYVAEKKLIKSEPFYKRKKLEEKESDQEKPRPKGEEYLFEQDWGEQLVGKNKSVLAQYDIDSDSLQILEGIPDNVCVAQPKYSPDGSHIVGVAYFVEPRKLGLVYCANRLSTIFQLDFEGNYLELSLEECSVKSPIFTPDRKCLVWLQREAGGPHRSCMTLVRTSIPLKQNSKVETIVDMVPAKIKINNNRDFYGIYTTVFSTRPWASNNRLLLNTNQKYTINSYVVNIDTGDITELEYENGSQLVIDVKDDVILALRRNFLVPDKLAIAKLPASRSESHIEWTEISAPVEVPELHGCTYEYLDLHASGETVSEFNAIYLASNLGDNTKVPLIVWPHGGPHSSFANFFVLEAAFFLSLGYSILLVNYRGSVGLGNDSIHYLHGKVGTADVQDCMLAVDAVLRECMYVNPNQLVLYGASHGGFLVAHLSGQYPDRFRAVVAKNPAYDIASKSIVSDSPDLSYVEIGEVFTQKGPPNNDILLKMRNASPIMHAHKVKAPTLLQVGSKDLRVPQLGHEFYHRLKANGLKVRMYEYEDNHPLGKIPHAMDAIINSALWFEEHLDHDNC